MGDFSFLSDSEDDKAVENLLSQAQDLSILEQVAAINCSNFLSDSDLPSHLQTRFQKLKSFPNTKPKTTENENFLPAKQTSGEKKGAKLKSKSEERNPDGKRGFEVESESEFCGSDSEDSRDNGIFSAAKQTLREKSSPKSKLKAKSKSRKGNPDKKKGFKVGSESDLCDSDSRKNGISAPAKQTPNEKMGPKSKLKAKSKSRRENPDGKRGLEVESESDSGDSHSKTSDSTENGIFTAAKQDLHEKIGSKSRSKPKSMSKKEKPDGRKCINVEPESDFDYSDSKESDSPKNRVFSRAKQYPDEKNCPKSKSNSEKQNPVGKKGLELDSQPNFGFSPSKQSDSNKNPIFSASKQYPSKKKYSKSNSCSSSEESESSTNKIGCFWCSPKKVFKKKSKENQISETDLNWGNEIDDDLFSFSMRKQKRMMKKTLKEQEKVNREAEKIVKWAKQASARLDVSSLEDDLSDSDCYK